MFLVLSQLPYVLVAIGRDLCPYTMRHIVLEVSFISVAISSDEGAFAMSLRP